MPSLFILAGANGSGKTTFYFSAKENNFISSAIPFVNVDMITKEELGGYSAQNFERANMIYREKVGGYIESMQDFMVESNLAKQTDFDWFEKRMLYLRTKFNLFKEAYLIDNSNETKTDYCYKRW